MLIASIMTDWMTSKNWEQKTMLKLARSGRSLSFGYFIIVMGTIVIAYYVHIGTIIRNIHQSQRYLMYRFDYIQKSPNYEITYFIQLCGGVCAILSNYSVDSFISIFLLHICAQLINLRTMLNDLIDKLNNRFISSLTFRKGLTAIIIRHEYLIRYIHLGTFNVNFYVIISLHTYHYVIF